MTAPGHSRQKRGHIATAPNPTARLAPAPPRPPRMTLASITRGRQVAPYRLLITGVDGVGKSTFAASAPAPIFLGPEDGTNHLDVARFPIPESFEDIREAICTLTADRGEFQTLAIDTIDWIEPLVWAHLCKAGGVASIESYAGGYGKGYVAALDEWRSFLADLERLQRVQGMYVVLIAHAFVKAFRNPEGDDFDRYALKMHDKAAALLREWCHGVYFANYETFAVKDKGKRVRGVSTGARLLYTQHTAAYDAKDRYGVPESLPLDWDEFVTAAASGRVSEAADTKAEIERKAKAVGGDAGQKAIDALGRAGDDPTKLAQLNNWINAKLGATNARMESEAK